MAPRAAAKQIKTDTTRVVSDLETLIGYNMKRAYVAIQKDFRAALGEGGLSPRTFSALSLVVAHPNISQSSLARMLGIERSGLVAIIDELERRNFLTRSVVPDDRRIQALVATSDGQLAYHDTLATVQAHEDRLLADLSASDKETLMQLLKKIRLTDKEGL
ncbi:DNA-binding MarR family transcriptional regulator [Loktanella sp. PT4BL]|jgi:DNA-binding MarR family transcriptional regulator|uniref:MarR family winged helix-turn-helix transcriptional regulator n=1 Tax=Loktanella sp. PT4BL TaxID=2135611 RepID=UPI000D76CF75|nr:MarR family transcriptional regulator [Loktanella sp. PT4BL]PXW70806.1 DNA-binding MarR family transcriptional regulator [Loktanella sp. PT4BL]